MLGVNFKGSKFIQAFKPKVNRLAYYLPYNFIIGKPDEGIIYLKPGALMRTYSFTCPDLGSSSPESIASISADFNESIRRLGSGWAVHFESRREETSEYPESSFDNSLGYLIDERRKDVYKNFSTHYLNYYFMTFTYEVKADLVSKGNTLLYRRDKDDMSDDYYNMENVSKEIQFFRDRTEEIISYMRSRIAFTPLDNSEVVTYIKSSLSSRWTLRFAPEEAVFFDDFITDENLETGEYLKIGNSYVGMVEVRDFPAESYPAIFDILNKADVSYRWVTRWIGMDKNHSAKLIEKYQKKFNNSRKSWGQVFAETAGGISTDRYDASAVAFEEETNEARVTLSKDIASFGYYTSCIEVWDENFDTLQAKCQYMAGLVNTCGFGAKNAGTNTFQAWLGSLPGNVYANVHKTLMASVNCTHMIPLSSIWTGDFYNSWTDTHIGSGAPLFTGSSCGSPFFMNMNVGDLFHTFIFGPSGAGKSTLLCFLETQFLKYKDARVIILDKDKTARGVCLGAGGTYVEPGADEAAFQPLYDLETEDSLMWACEFIELCLTEQHVKVDAKISEDVRLALCQLRDTKNPDKRDITSFQQYVQNEQVRLAIQPYTIDGQYGRIFDAHGTNINMSRFTMIEMGTLMRMGKACITPALMYLFRFIESNFAAPNDDLGHPTMLVLDEAWVFLNNPYFEVRIDDWLRTLRKRHVAVVFATQDVVNASRSNISATIISQCMTRIYLADPNATSRTLSECYKVFGLDDAEIYNLSRARMKNDYFYKSPMGARMFTLELDKFQLALIAPRKEVLDALENHYGRNGMKELAPEILRLSGFNPDFYLAKWKKRKN